MANIAAYYFYQDQPEIATKMYQRLMQLGMSTAELWNNLALCCFYSNKFDLFFTCFSRALDLARDQPLELSDIWYNIGTVYISLGNAEFAARCFRLSISCDPEHSESLNNLAVLEARKGNLDTAITLAERSFKFAGGFEAAFNLSVWYTRQNNIKSAKQYNGESIKLYGLHIESLQLRSQLDAILQL